ncbi:MAG: DNA polymerase I [Rhodothermales bacterium]
MVPANETDAAFDRGKLYLLDAMALAYRSHFVFISRPLINSKGQNTSAAYGFTNSLMKLIEDHGMAHMAVVFDVVGEDEETFRDEMYEEYKANRSPIPEDLVENLPYIKRIVRALDVPVLEVSGVEADDVIGTLARRAAGEGADVVIVSPDKDFQQLLDPHISIFKPARRGEQFDPITADSFREKYGLDPDQFIDMLALMGDSSDNVPGVRGIGEKTAMKLLKKYGSVEELLEHAEDIKGKRAREGLLEYRDEALLSKRLVTIKTDVDVDVDWHRFKRANPDRSELLTLFKELEFNTLFDKVRTGELVGANGAAVHAGDDGIEGTVETMPDIASYDEGNVVYHQVRSRGDLEDLADVLGRQDRFAFDTETTSTDPMWASLVGISFSWEANEAWYVPTPMPDGTPTEEVMEILAPVLGSDRLKIGQNLKYDIVTLERHGLRVEGPLFDTMVAHYLIAPEEPHGLDALSLRLLNYKMVPISDLIGTGKNQRSMREVSVEEVCPYACEDADIALRLADVLNAELEEEGLLEIAEAIEFPLIRVLADMEVVGIKVDPAILDDISQELEAQIAELEVEIHERAGEEFNIASTQQLGAILFEKLGLRVVSKTGTGAPSTKESVLEELSTEHALPGLVLDWRKLTKLKSTYVDSLGDLIHPETGRVHTSYNQTVAATGRLSSSGPNLQNIPIRTDRGREIRKAFVAEDGWKLLSADYVQIELRILASMSGDEGLSEAFRRGEDIHRAAAARIFDIPPENVTRDQRRKAKEVNYGIPYGISAWGLAQRLRCTMSEAQELIDTYMRSYSSVTAHINRVVDEARKKGYVETILGRRRFVPNIDSRNRTQRSFAERVAVNMPIQGSQADMIKIAMVRIDERLRAEGLRTRMLLQVHDELVFEVPDKEIETVRELVRAEMVEALPLDVPVEVDMDFGENWLDAH